MRIAIGGFSHETNTFNPRPTTLADFQGESGQWLVGEQLTRAYQGTRTVIGGMLDVCRDEGLTVVPIFFATHGPTTGVIAADAIGHILESLAAGIRDANPDGVLLN